MLKIKFFPENFSNNLKYKSSKNGTLATRFISILLGVGIAFSMNSSIKDNDNDNLNVLNNHVTVMTSSSDINDKMNIILNDGDCSNTFFKDVTDKLKSDGFSFTTTANFNDINIDNATVITLDQQYSAGEGTIIFAPFNNTRLGHSDSLAISMQSAFNQNGFLADDILCSQIGFREDENGNISYFVPTPTEDAIDDDKDTSFVTISFGTYTTNPEWVAKSIENGLARQYHYLEEYDNQTDLLYRASESDSIDVVADYFGTSPLDLKKVNGMSEDCFTNSQTVINPSVKDIDLFNQDSVFYLDGEKTKAY